MIIRHRRVYTLVLAALLILFSLHYIASSSTGANSFSSASLLNVHKSFGSANANDASDNYGTSSADAAKLKPTSSPEDALELANLYLLGKDQKIPIPSSVAHSGLGAGNVPDGSIAKSQHGKGQLYDDRSLPSSNHQLSIEESITKIDPKNILKGDITFQNYFNEIFELMNRNTLNYPLAERLLLKDGKPFIENVLFFAQAYDRLSESDLSNFVKFTPQFVNDLTLKHEIITQGLPDEIPTNLYNGSGYVIVGGGKYSWFALLGIETLRKLGSTLPVEVILPNEEDYEFEYCDQILPSLNARCVEMTRVFGKQVLKKFDISGYQYKSFALLCSSFENAFLLDSDTFPLSNPDGLFTSELYSKYQMITWPDFWRRTTSPLYYKIAGLNVGKTQVRHLNDFFTDPKYYAKDFPNNDPFIDIPYHDREGTIPDWTTESGEMLINKTLHFKTLLLSLYYNFDGPYGYYPLLSQGGAGEGDKETFVAAAHYYGLPYYQVYKYPDRAYGWYNDELNFEHSSIVQYDPIRDYELLKESTDIIQRKIDNAANKGEVFNYNYEDMVKNYFQPENSKPLFYHVHDPKMDPFNIVEKRFTYDLQGNKIRNLGGDFPTFENQFDLELFIWEVIDHYVCKKMIEFSYFDNAPWNSLCTTFITEQLEFLKNTNKVLIHKHKKELAKKGSSNNGGDVAME